MRGVPFAVEGPHKTMLPTEDHACIELRVGGPAAFAQILQPPAPPLAAGCLLARCFLLPAPLQLAYVALPGAACIEGMAACLSAVYSSMRMCTMGCLCNRHDTPFARQCLNHALRLCSLGVPYLLLMHHPVDFPLVPLLRSLLSWKENKARERRVVVEYEDSTSKCTFKAQHTCNFWFCCSW